MLIATTRRVSALPPVPVWLSPDADPRAIPEKDPAETEARETSSRPTILLVEDNPADVDLVRESLREHGVACELLTINDGEKAVHHVGLIEKGEADCPALIVLDLNLPRRNGLEVLAVLRSGNRCGPIPVIVLSSSLASRDVAEANALGATLYLRKPLDLEEFFQVGATLKRFLSPK